MKKRIDKSRFGRAVYLTHDDRIIMVTNLKQALDQLENGWPDKTRIEHAIAHNACTLAARSIYDASRARKLFVAAARAAGIH